MSEASETSHPAGQRPSRLARISSWVMIVSLGATIFLLSLAVMAHSAALMYPFCVVGLIAFLSALVRLSCSIFRESQTRLSELLLCVLTVGALASALTLLLPEDLVPEARPIAAAGIVLMSCLAVAAGAAWGWSAAQRRGETRQGRRVLLLVYGWLIVLGFPAGVAAVIICLVLIFRK
jgi:hypothetical protein